MTCSRCNGTGTATVTDIVDWGSTTVAMRTGITCPDCLEQGLCPQCEAPLIDDGEHEEKCLSCGWNDPIQRRFALANPRAAGRGKPRIG